MLMPLVVLAALIVLQVAFVVRDQVAVVHAAREAARAASVDPDSGSAVRAAMTCTYSLLSTLPTGD